MNLMNDPIPNRPDIELNTEKAGGVAGKVDRDQIVTKTYIQVNNPNPTENAALVLDINPSDYTPEELAQLIDTIMKSVSIIGDGTLKLAYYKKGSIKLVLNGSPEDIAELKRLINSKELTQIEGHNISEIQETTPTEDEKISLIQQIKTSESNQRRANLRRANLRRAYLRRANLRRAYLSGAYLSGAYLSGADLSGADLSWADLSWAYLSGADLRGADLRRAYLRGADLSGADLSEADLRRADLSGADLSGADLSGANLSGADLRRADLSEAKLENATVLEAHFGENQGIDKALTMAFIEKDAIFQRQLNNENVEAIAQRFKKQEVVSNLELDSPLGVLILLSILCLALTLLL